MEPEAIVRFNYTNETFQRKTYESIVSNNIEVIHKLSKYARGPSGNSNYKINERLKCYITGGGNYKLHDGTFFTYKHKEHEIRKPKGKLSDNQYNSQAYRDFKNAEQEYYDWSCKVRRAHYINSHLDEFDIKIEWCSNHRSIDQVLIDPIKIEL